MNSLAPPHGERDLRLDFFRGLALITIFINHVPGTVFEIFTSRNFGFSDAAEAFVLMSGISAGLAYSNAFVRDQVKTRFLILKRASRLYAVHLLSTVIAISVLLAGHFFFDTDPLSKRINLYPVLHEQAEWLLGFLSLGHQLGYFNILPLYMVLLGITPLLLPLAIQNPWRLVATAAVIWLFAGLGGINLPNFPGEGFWFLNPFGWQLVFVIGLVIGVQYKRGAALLPYHPVLMAFACSYAVVAAVVVQSGRWEWVMFSSLPAILGGFDKGLLPLPRLLHVLALAYIVVNIPAFSRLAVSRFSAPVVSLGKQSLAVFAWGSVISISLQMFKEATNFTPWMDFSGLAFGLWLQYLVARHFNTIKASNRTRSNEPVAPR